MSVFRILTILLFLFAFKYSTSQVEQLVTQDTILFSFEPAAQFNKKRFMIFSGASAITYGAILYGFDRVWYKDFPKSDFQFFNDGGEWMDMDKLGHAHAAYFESEWIYSMSRWAGIRENNAIWTGVGVASALQLTVEMFDAYSKQWGFSWWDVAANTSGVALFGIQQALWSEQRIRLKFSASLVSYPKEELIPLNNVGSSSIDARAKDLYGNTLAEQLLKDYNGQTYWLSINPASFINRGKKGRFEWLNIAFGLGANNMLGGYYNSWELNGGNYSVEKAYPRYREYYLSLDVDWSRIPAKKAWLRTLFKGLNVIKIPFPALMYSGQNGFEFNALHF